MKWEITKCQILKYLVKIWECGRIESVTDLLREIHLWFNDFNNILKEGEDEKQDVPLYIGNYASEGGFLLRIFIVSSNLGAIFGNFFIAKYFHFYYLTRAKRYSGISGMISSTENLMRALIIPVTGLSLFVSVFILWTCFVAEFWPGHDFVWDDV